ncbi:hypothetical protein MLD38_011727 [Melastoma candidum]|uniref:Uncharacterized protein n=1 Tax=Melastoma candidum TaxID=119954 RepID=A0ACB9R431_9MYRT|nr:hypothetical protein MLD38_011727 [Melastoma candidum]
MVWGLFPVDPLQGEDKYYIFKKGTFKVGRKGCDIIVNKDKGVSRVHAEIIVNSMNASCTRAVKNPSSSGDVVIRDCSKYGTFINKNLGSQGKVHELPIKEASLGDGDIVSFGTGSASFRFCYVPIVCFLFGMDSLAASAIKDQLASIGASATNNLSEECTHILFDEGAELQESVLDAIASKKPLVLSSWVQSLAEKSIRSEIPGFYSDIPTLLVEGLPVKVADPKTRESCLKDYIFLLGPIGKYKFGNGLQKSVQATGANVLAVDEFHASSHGPESDARRVVSVIPRDLCTNEITKVGSMSRVRELDLVRAVLSGHLDTTNLLSIPVVISSSCSTDETIVADSDVEEEGTSSIRILSMPQIEETVVPTNQQITPADHPSPTGEDDRGHINDHSLGDYSSKIRSDKPDVSAEGTSDIIYSQDLIVMRLTKLPATSSTEPTVVNFKCFKKKNVPSGNSFDNLVPFSKLPFKDSVYESEQVEAAKEEKKRKQLEAMAEELFNNDKGRQRKLTGTLHGIFARS